MADPDLVVGWDTVWPQQSISAPQPCLKIEREYCTGRDVYLDFLLRVGSCSHQSGRHDYSFKSNNYDPAKNQ